MEHTEQREALAALNAQERVEIMLEHLPGVSDYPWEGGLNGQFYRIKRGVRVCVPKSIAELISENERVHRASAGELMEYARGRGKRLG